MLNEMKSRNAGKKYDAKYFGTAIGIFSLVIFLLAVTNMALSGRDYSFYLKPLIPFFNSVNTINIIGGIVVSFLWGWVLGYFFIVIYHWFDKKLNPRESNL